MNHRCKFLIGLHVSMLSVLTSAGITSPRGPISQSSGLTGQQPHVFFPPFSLISRRHQNYDKFTRGRILERNWDTSLKGFSPCYSQSPFLKDFMTPPPPTQQKCFETGF